MEDQRMGYIGVGRRFVALLIDGVVSLLWSLPLSEITSTRGRITVSLTGWRFVVALLLDLTYFVLMEGLLGATVGKFVMGIRVRRPDGTQIGLGPATGRNLMRVVDAFPYVIPYLVGAVAVWSSPTDQRLGDRVGGTVVVTKDSTVASSPTPPPPGSGSAPAGDTGPALPPPPPGALP